MGQETAPRNPTYERAMKAEGTLHTLVYEAVTPWLKGTLTTEESHEEVLRILAMNDLIPNPDKLDGSELIDQLVITHLKSSNEES